MVAKKGHSRLIVRWCLGGALLLLGAGVTARRLHFLSMERKCQSGDVPSCRRICSRRHPEPCERLKSLCFGGQAEACAQ